MCVFYGIIGCGGHARAIADTILFLNENANIIFFDDNARDNEIVMGRFKVLKLSDNIESLKTASHIVIGLGDNEKRRETADFLKENIKPSSEQCKSLISNGATIGHFSDVGIWSYIANKVHVGPEVHIGNGTIINSGAIVEHNCTVGSFSHISVNAAICGKSRIGNNVFVGAGAVVKDKISICDNVVVGAGSVVVKDLVEPGTYVGVPAKIVSK